MLALILAGCRGRPTTTVQFAPATGDLLNPERGFMVDVDLLGELDVSHIRERGYTLAYAGVRLDAHRHGPLPEQLLRDLDAGFGRVRRAGFKVVLRFVYNDTADGADATKWQILAHIAQLTPLLHANADVIAVMDAGFIGAWGEWHSSSNGLDNPRDRGDIIYALLRALPATRSLTLRSPIYRIDAYGGPIDPAYAFNGADPSRVGHHNSCFLASDTDLGTYAEPVEHWKEIVAQDGRFAPVGGETCALNPPRTDCATATSELRRLHWSFLNALYHREVLDRWQAQHCYAEIARDLGYRLELRSATFDRTVAPGAELQLTVRLANTGYAAMFNARPVYITFDDIHLLTDLDPRRWEPGEDLTFTRAVRIPAGARPGKHRLGIYLPDADPRLQTPELAGLYAVRLANTRWDAPVNVISDEVTVSAP